MKLYLYLPLLFMTLLASGCSQTTGPYTGSGTDKLPQSECSPCKKQIIYRNGQWL